MKILLQTLMLVFTWTSVSANKFEAAFIHVPANETVFIRSPGFPNINYARDKTYRWHVDSYDREEKLSIKINREINGLKDRAHQCLDYLQIQHIRGSSTYKECGEKERNITSKGNQLVIDFVSNNDTFTSKGFELIIRGLPKSTSDVTTMDASLEKHRTTIDISISLNISDDMRETTLPSQSADPTSNNLLQMKTVLVLVGLGVVELTLIIGGIPAVVKHRRRRKTDRNNDRSHTRQNSCTETHVYDIIEFDDIDEHLEEDKGPYKELPEGEFDEIFEPRPHVNNTEVQNSIYSKEPSF